MYQISVLFLIAEVVPKDPSMPEAHVSVSQQGQFYGEELLAPRPTPRLEDQPLSIARDCLFNIFAATLHIGGRSSICNLRTCHAVVTGSLCTSPFIQIVILLYSCVIWKSTIDCALYKIRDRRNVCNIFMVKLGKCPRGMPRRIWENDITTGLRKRGCYDGKGI
jgi:hypothetical protein